MEKHSQPITDGVKPIEEQVPEIIQQDLMRISINRLGNFKNVSLPFNAQIRIDWMNQRFESEKFSVETEGDVDLTFQAVIQSSTDTYVMHQQFLDNPVYIVLLGLPPSTTSASKKSKRSTATAGTKSAGKKRSAIPIETVIGASCLDVLPILMGSDSLQNTLPLQSERQLFGSEIVAWPNLPYVEVAVQPLLDFNSVENMLPGNYMTIGLEGIYNLKCSSGSVLGGISLPVFQNNEAHEHFMYKSVKWVDRPNEGRKFKWANMVSAVEGCAANSEYEIVEDTGDISNVMEISLNELQKIGIAPRLEWNRMHRCLLTPHCQQYIENQIARYKNLPMEFMLTNDEMTLKMKSKSKETVDIPKEHLVAYPDLSRLMFPGVTSTRLVTQIYTFTKNSFIERAGEKNASIFDVKPPKEVLPPARTGKDAKKAKGRPASKAATASSKTTEAEEVILEEESIPLQTKDGLPVFVVMQISLHKPLIPKKTEEEFMFDLQNLIPKRVEKPVTIKNAEKAYNDYCLAIKDAHNFILESYREYASKYPRNLGIGVFEKYLEDTGMLSKIKAHLRERVQDYMVFKIGLPSKIDKECVFQDFLAKSYIKLVEDMRLTVTNRNLDKSNSGRSVVCCYPSEVGIDALHIFACEAAEENDKDKAKSFLLKMIDMDFASSFPLIKMVILLMQENNIDEAEVYTKEIISIDTRHPIGLLLYAIYLFMKEDFNTSELFFHAVTTFHPNFIEAWISFYLFYWHLQMFEEAKIILNHVDKFLSSIPSSKPINQVIDENDVSKNISTEIVDPIASHNIPIDGHSINQDKVDESLEQCNDDNNRSNSQLNSDNLELNSEILAPKPLDAMSYVGDDVLEPILSWFPEICDDNCATFLKTAIFLLNLRCFMFAEMCLNKVRLLSNNDEIIVIIEYLLACCDYLRHRPENALQHLDTALRFNIQPIPLHLLSGHCHYKLENFEKMEESYSFVQGLPKNPIPFQLHLMYLRLGKVKFGQENFILSSQFYYKSCEQICTPLAWLGMAKTDYMLDAYIDAERCLCDANLLDCENGEIWSYLALVNHQLYRPAVFLDCYHQTKRFPCNIEMLRNEIGELYYSFYESNCFINRRTDRTVVLTNPVDYVDIDY